MAFHVEPIHERLLGYFGYTLQEAQSLPDSEKDELRDKIFRCIVSAGPKDDLPPEIFDEDGMVRDEDWEALDDLYDMTRWPSGTTSESQLGYSCFEDEGPDEPCPEDEDEPELEWAASPGSPGEIPPFCVFEDGEWRPCPYD